MVTLICGLPNAGKTTYSKHFENVVHFDECPQPRHKIFEEIVAKAEGDVVAEGVCNSKRSRAMFLHAIRHKDERKVCIWIDTPLEECIRRENAYRKRPVSMVEEHGRRFEPPTYEEGWDEIIRITAEDTSAF